MHDTVIYPARRILTMNRGAPFAQAVAVREGKVLAVGTVEELQSWGPAVVDERFADKVIAPGFVEAHSHVMSGGAWRMPYVGFFDRTDPQGNRWTGCTTIDEVIDRLIEVESTMEDPSELLLAWGLDPIYFTGERLLAKHLDRVSTVRQIFVYHANGHLASVNTAMLNVSEITAASTSPGVARDADGNPNGELQESAMSLASSAFVKLRSMWGSPEAKWNYAYEARNAGHTFITDLGTTPLALPGQAESWRTVVEDPAYPARVMVAFGTAFGGSVDPAVICETALRLKAESSDKLHFGIVKLVLDGSIQGFTARVSWPYYYRPPEGHEGNGLWLLAPEQVRDLVKTFHAAGITIHAHCNGDQATEVFVDAVEAALEAHPRWDHRHTVQHCQMTTPAQYKRMAALGMCANIFSNHIYYWGDQHRDRSIGPERAAKMDACATALHEGVSISIHSDAPVTPMGHLHTMWCAVNRLTSTGQVLGPDERISVEDALYAVTIGAAFQLKLDHLIGSIEVGKFADFAILDDDPLLVDPVVLKDIKVWGTMVGGVAFQAGATPQ
jgi:predicted amidohydrolase YtcJ